MRVRQRVRDVSENATREVERRPPLPLEIRGETLALDERHDEENESVHFVDAVDRHDVRVTQLRGRLRLPQKPGANLLAKRELRGQELDGNGPAKTNIARAKHHAHATTTDLIGDLVPRSDGRDEASEQLVRHRPVPARRRPLFAPTSQ